jgi:hypothetical protein
MTLLAILRLGDDMYGVPLSRELSMCVVARFRLEASMLRWAGWS